MRFHYRNFAALARHSVLACGVISPARMDEFPLQLQADLPCPVPSAKRFHFACRANHNYKLAPSRASSEGRFAIVTKRWARDAMDASAQKANESEADGEAAWS
jgi:hypothetical protein